MELFISTQFHLFLRTSHELCLVRRLSYFESILDILYKYKILSQKTSVLDVWRGSEYTGSVVMVWISLSSNWTAYIFFKKECFDDITAILLSNSMFILDFANSLKLKKGSGGISNVRFPANNRGHKMD